MADTSQLPYRVLAVVLGVAAALGSLELALRVASAVLRPGPPVIEGTGPDNEIRVLCIGESTTAGLWPGLLEAALNRQHRGLHFRVVNAGQVGILTGEVRARLPQWLDQTRPQIAITMLGINDEGNVLVYPRSDRRAQLVERSKALKLIALLWRSARAAGDPPDAARAEPGPDAEAHWPPAVRGAIERITEPRREALESFRYSVLLDTQPALLEVDPATPTYHVGLMLDALIGVESQQSMADFCDRVLHLPEAGGMTASERYRAIRAWGAGHGNAFDTARMLTSAQRLDGDVAGEEQTLVEAQRDPAIAGPLKVRHAAFLAVQQRQVEAAAMLRLARGMVPEDYAWSLALARVAFKIGAYEDASSLLARALEVRPDLPPRHEQAIVGWLARAAAAAGRDEEARVLFERLDRITLSRFKEYTRFNYSRIVDLLRERDITVIAMQYPTLSVEALRRLLDQRQDVIYLENRHNFEQALRDVPYHEIFYDSFAGSFGHCTPAGEELIAANVAQAVSEVVGRRPTSQAGQPAPLPR